MDRLAVLARHLQLQAGQDGGIAMQETSTKSPIQAEMGRVPVLPGGRAEYEKLHKWSLEDPEGFWGKMAEALYWYKRWQPKHHSFNFDVRKGPISAEWFKGGRTNMCYNCLDRWVEAGRGNQACFLWEGNGAPVFRARTMSYREVLDETCRLANWLRQQGVRKGDAVAVYLPMTCELPIAMLACARIGALHTVVFAGFSAEALAQRIQDSKAKVVITATGVWRGPKAMALKTIVNKALDISKQGGHQVRACLVFEKTAVPLNKAAMVDGRDAVWQEAVREQPNECAPEWVDAEDPLFLLYTSGSTGNPKGVVHTTGGYMVQAYTSTRYVFDLQPGDVYWCTADCGWVTGHTYLTYGPLLAGATNVLFGSTPMYPTIDRVWQVIARYKVRVFYTAPTLIRSLMLHGEEPVKRHDLSSLRVLGTVGEPIGDEAWRWYDEVVGGGRCPIVDTWWQTETGSASLTPLAGAWETVPGWATLPFFGVQPVLLNEKAEELQGPCEGILAFKRPWPSMLRGLYKNQERFEEAYFSAFKGYYMAGDGAVRDARGYIKITGRLDDVLNVSGHRLGTAELENALTQHPACDEAAVIGIDHDVKGTAVYAYVTLSEGAPKDRESVRQALLQHVRSAIGAFAVPEV
mmetsp:Transcript_3580/g.10404  ORF Transcript_3580/g.10404 Transcript_3580/m.10404 type:complete len:633 (-) Transcript_3580:1161-3059(-)